MVQNNQLVWDMLLADIKNEDIPAFDTTAYDDLFLNLRNSLSKK